LNFQKLAITGATPVIAPPGHADGWGIAYYENNSPICTVSAQAADADPGFARIVHEASMHSVSMAHLRKASLGAISPENCQPFTEGSFTFCHNGTIEDSKNLPLNPHRRKLLRGDTDSEVLFQLIMQCIDEAGDTEKGLRRAISLVQETCPYTALNLLLATGETVYVLREVNEDHPLVRDNNLCDCYYTLYFQDVDGLVISSEPLGKYNWQMIENHELKVF